MQKTFRIVHLSSAHPDADVRIFLKECRSLAKRFPECEIHLVLAGVQAREEDGVFIHTVPPRSGNRLQRMWNTVNQVYKKAQELNGDIYHLHDPELLRIALKLKKGGKKVIYDAHEDLPRQLLGKSYLPMKKWAARAFEAYEDYTVKKLDAVVTATPFIRERFAKIHPLVVDINNYPLLSEIEFNELGQEERTHVAYIGGISRIRGISQLVEAIAYTGTTLHLAGEIAPDYLEELRSNPGWTRVVPCGHVSRKDAQAIKQKAFAGVVTFLPLPNHVNAQPNKIFEYMASGIPVIGSHFPLWKNLIQDHEVGICVNPEHPNAIADAIETLRNNPEKAREMGTRGKELVTNTFNWNAEEEKLVALYQTLIHI